MGVDSEINIKLKSFGGSDYYDLVFLILALGPIGAVFLFQGVIKLIFEEFSFYFLIGILVGTIALLTLFISLKTISKSIIIYADNFEVQFLWNKIRFEYSEVEWIKFMQPYKSSKRIIIRLKTRKHGIKSLPINLHSKKEDLMKILNHARTMDIPTGLNEIGEQYFKFNKITGKYEAIQDERIDIAKTW